MIDPIDSAINAEHARQQWEIADWKQFAAFLNGLSEDDRDKLRESVMKRASQWECWLCPGCDQPHPTHAWNCSLNQK